MKNNTFTLIVIACFLITHTVFGQGHLDIQADLEAIVNKEADAAEKHLSFRSHESAPLTDMHYQVMRWEVDPAVFYIKGDITYYFKSNVDGLTTLILDLSNELSVNTITRNATSLAYTHTPDQLLTIQLGRTLNIGDRDSLRITYEGIPQSNGFGSFVQSTHQGQPIIWTLSEPYGCRDWWPAKQDLIDKVDSIDVYVTTPLNLLAAGNGKLMGITESNGKHVHHWRHRYPIAAYLIALSVTNYTAYSDYFVTSPTDSIEILNYMYPEYVEEAKLSSQLTKDFMGLFNELFGLYPFADEKYGHAQFGWGGGMEHQTMSFMVNLNYGLVAHELAHQWFGDKVTCGTWKEIWLNEGFATYLTGLTLERFSANEYWPLWKSSTSNSATSQPGGSVYVPDTTDVNRIFSNRLTYNKGAYLLHMLRWVMGDDQFFAACRDYLNNPGTAYDFGRVAELQHYLETRSGIDLDEFFADWYYGEGYPSYVMEWEEQPDSVVFTLSQLQSHPSVSFFEMPVPVTISENGNHYTFVLQHTGQFQRFAFFTGDVEIDSVKLDPERWILTRDNIVTEFITGVHDVFNQDYFRPYPNPANDFLQFEHGEEIASVSLVDAVGKSISVAWNAQKANVSAVPAGSYIARLQNTAGELIGIVPVVIVH
jgi:aminopeptidase N